MAFAVLPIHHGAAGFHAVMGQARRDEALVQHQRRVGQCLVDVAIGPLHVGFPGGKLTVARAAKSCAVQCRVSTPVLP